MAKPPPADRGRHPIQSIDNKTARSVAETALSAARSSVSYTRVVQRPVGIHDVRPVYRYVQNWGRRGDAGVLALEGPHAYGAAWYRLFTAGEPGFGFVDERTPEVTIAIVPSRRGKGAGQELLEALLERARADGYAAVSLSAAPEQTSYYARFGFETVREDEHAVTMVARL